MDFKTIVSTLENVIIKGDKLKIRESISNLIENAIKYSPRKSSIELILYNHDNRVDILVSDDGPGIDMRDQLLIFNKSSRTKYSNKINPQSGSGLGLYFVKQVAKAHQGEVMIESVKVNGSIIGVSLPIYQNTE